MGGTVVPIDHAFDQRRTSLVGKRDLDRLGELAAVGGAQAPALPVLGIEDLHQPGVVPVLDVVVRPVVDRGGALGGSTRTQTVSAEPI